MSTATLSTMSAIPNATPAAASASRSTAPQAHLPHISLHACIRATKRLRPGMEPRRLASLLTALYHQADQRVSAWVLGQSWLLTTDRMTAQRYVLAVRALPEGRDVVTTILSYDELPANHPARQRLPA